MCRSLHVAVLASVYISTTFVPEGQLTAQPRTPNHNVTLAVSIPPNSWMSGTPMPTSREQPFVGVIGQQIYVVGGGNSSTVLNVNEVYNTATDSWTTAAPMPTARWDGASAVVNNI